MEVKLTKTQLKEIEEKEKEKRRNRRLLIESVDSLRKDIAAVERVAKINNDKSKIDSYGNLKKEEADRLTDNYAVLKFLVGINGRTNKSWSAVNYIIKANKFMSDYINNKSKVDECLRDDSAIIDDIMWAEDKQIEQYLRIFKEFGIKYIYFLDRSTAALLAITGLIKYGAEVIGTTTINEYYEDQGIIFDITGVRLEDRKENA